MNARIASLLAAGLLGSFPPAAHAQYIPPWMIAAVLSPILVLMLCLVLGWVARSARTGLRHAALVILWVVLFWLASYFVENDYVIWTPLALYVLHTALLVVLIAVGIARRMGGEAP